MNMNELTRLSDDMAPLAHFLKRVTDEVRPSLDPNHNAVGTALAVISELFKARNEEDLEQRIAVLESLIMSLATLVYREKQSEFEDFINGSASLVVSDALNKMLH